MDFRCINPKCSELYGIITIGKVTFKQLNNVLVPDLVCVECKQIMEDVTLFEGYGTGNTIKKNKKLVSKNWYKRYKGK